MIVMTNAVAGKADELNDWYSNVHIADILKLPGAVGGQRFVRAAVARNSVPVPFEYLAIYDIETDDLQAFIENLYATGGTAAMPVIDALDKERFVCFFEELTDRLEARA
jgi:hypothetical protein